ncbi:MAG: hypothetical protein ABI614_00695 [Planctomycetota bacterium]
MTFTNTWRLAEPDVATVLSEVPGVAGELPRIVLATFIGYSSDRDEIFVWS